MEEFTPNMSENSGDGPMSDISSISGDQRVPSVGLTNKQPTYNNFNKYKTTEQLLEIEERKLKRELQNEKKRQKGREEYELKKQRELEEQERQKERAIKGMTYLLGKSKMYSQFLGDKLESHLNNNANPESKKKILKDRVNNDNITKIPNDTVEIPKYFTGGTLRPYQIEGLTWLKLLFENGINGILADEMGLGKTIQIIAFMAYLYEKNIPGPYLIIAPLSVTTNWMTEFKKFAPKLPVILFHADKDGRILLRRKIMERYEIDGKPVKPVIVMSYQTAVTEETFLNKFIYSYIILDEAQHIKNSESQRYKHIDHLRSDNRLLLTGTPLQNNLSELWALLHFLMPKIFGSKTDTTFTSVLNLQDFKNVDVTVENDKITNIISTIHGVLNPFMLRRLKKDVLKDIVPKKELIVYCPLSDLQRTLIKYVIERNLNLLTGKEQEPEIDVNEPRKKRKTALVVRNYTELEFTQTTKEDDDEFIKYLVKQNEVTEENRKLMEKLKENNQTAQDGIKIIKSVNLASPWMVLRELADHPYLLHMPTVENKQGKREIKVDENLITTSGKMRVLDLLLPRLKAENHKVLIFSCFVMMLDIVEEYLIYRNYTYARLDGAKKLEQRNFQIDKFCGDQETFIFLISTRAGGVGLNLVEADTVIFMDLDCNPQVDIQAQDRCHRIGQTKPVMIYKFISMDTIDERILSRGEMKKRLEKSIITNCRLSETMYKSNISLTRDDLLQLLKSVETTKEIRSTSSNKQVLSPRELNQLLDRSDLYKELNERLDKINENNKK
ncbi:lymphoid-specific helicase-like isoform X2 [Chrysoperla carnea]|nr:lymphoid-specific helicase-like isoform X2 [Chrysoperla carnea]XP_044733900.1 lymphoid-specific helicase-like isoform X2 [Chrysoperla carnea]XP_044733901.1 lymphoid-specific helicase-like isoform X2 [Chrysoperla carnea]